MLVDETQFEKYLDLNHNYNILSYFFKSATFHH